MVHAMTMHSVIKRTFVHRARPHLRLGLRQLLELSMHRHHRLIRRADGISAMWCTRSSPSSSQQYASRESAVRHISAAMSLAQQRLGQVFWHSGWTTPAREPACLLFVRCRSSFVLYDSS